MYLLETLYHDQPHACYAFHPASPSLQAPPSSANNVPVQET